MSVLRSVKGLSVLITGASSGLGRGTAEVLSKHGANITIVDLPSSKGGEVAKSLGSAIFAPADISNDAQVKEAFGAVKDKFGRLDAVVNCAGIAQAFKLYSVNKKTFADPERIRKTIEVNVLGSFNVIRHGVALIGENEKDGSSQRGVVINTASIAAFDGQIGQGAIVSMTLPLARDFAEDGIRFVTIAPGLFKTPLLTHLPDKVQSFLSQLVPNPARMGDPQEYGELARHIIENGYINGEIIRLDGALRMPP